MGRKPASHLHMGLNYLEYTEKLYVRVLCDEAVSANFVISTFLVKSKSELVNNSRIQKSGMT